MELIMHRTKNMKIATIIAVICMALPVMACAATSADKPISTGVVKTMSCAEKIKGKIDHVLVESGNHDPFPILIPPDVGADGNATKQEWNFLNKDEAAPPVTIHCYTSRDDSVGAKFELPRNIKRCAYAAGEFICK
jgi:hypothetical protein